MGENSNNGEGRGSSDQGEVQQVAPQQGQRSADGHVHGPNCQHGHHHHHHDHGHHVTNPIMRSGEKVGRNDPCPCGSQKKFKKCCGR